MAFAHHPFQTQVLMPRLRLRSENFGGEVLVQIRNQLRRRVHGGISNPPELRSTDVIPV